MPVENVERFNGLMLVLSFVVVGEFYVANTFFFWEEAGRVVRLIVFEVFYFYFIKLLDLIHLDLQFANSLWLNLTSVD